MAGRRSVMMGTRRVVAFVGTLSLAVASLAAVFGVAPAGATAGVPDHLVFSTQPGNGTGGSALGAQPVVTIQDSANATVATDTAQISLHITPGTPGPGGPGTLTCAPVNAVAGVATFSGCKIDTTGTGYRLTADDLTDGLTVTSSTFDVTVGAAAQLAFSTQPANGTAGSALVNQPVVSVDDVGGNAVTTDSGRTVSLTLGGGTNPGGGILSGCNAPTEASGVFAFSGCQVSIAGTGYTLTAMSTSGSPAVSNATSQPFNVSSTTADHLAFTTEPGNGIAATLITANQPVVSVEDSANRVVTTDSGRTVSLTLGGGTNPGGGILSGCNAPTEASGVFAFSGCQVSIAGTGYTLTAMSTSGSPAVSNATSNAFTITGPAGKLVFSTEPTKAIAGSSLLAQPVVTVEDANNNVVPTNTNPVTLAITPGTGTPGAALHCINNPVTTLAGSAPFSGCTIDKPGVGYTLRASDGGLVTTSTAFDVLGPTPLPIRIFGTDAIATAISVSQAEFPTAGSASGLVLARSDFFSDALAGGPLAANVGGPLLITPGTPLSSSLDPRVLTEIQRVLPTGKTVYILGGPAALSANIDAALTNAGYVVQRVQGPNEYATAVAIASQLGNPSTVFEATGLFFADALSAVPAAINAGGAILLTNGTSQAPETAFYLGAHPGDTRYAIGGPRAAAGADPTANPVYGIDLYGTSATVAFTFFPNAPIFGAATGVNYPDALAGGVYMATGGRLGPVLLVNTHAPLPGLIAGYLALLPVGTQGYVFGGPLAVGDDVSAALQAAVG